MTMTSRFTSIDAFDVVDAIDAKQSRPCEDISKGPSSHFAKQATSHTFYILQASFDGQRDIIRDLTQIYKCKSMYNIDGT